LSSFEVFKYLGHAAHLLNPEKRISAPMFNAAVTLLSVA